MFDFGWAELLVIGGIALFVIGPKDLPGIAYQAGKVFRRLRYMQYALSGQFEDFMKQAEAKAQSEKTRQTEKGENSDSLAPGTSAPASGDKGGMRAEEKSVIPPDDAELPPLSRDPDQRQLDHDPHDEAGGDADLLDIMPVPHPSDAGRDPYAPWPEDDDAAPRRTPLRREP